MRFLSGVFRYATFVLSLAGMVMMAFVIQRIRGQEATMPPPPVPPPQKPFDDTVAATGIIEAVDENVSIGTPGAGLIAAVEVKVNQEVDEGEVLLRMDDRELQAMLVKQQAQVDLAGAKIEVQKAMVAKVADMLERVQSVGGRGVSVDEVQQRANDLKVSRAQAAAVDSEWAAARAEVKQTELLIDRLIVRAPRRGTILQVNVRSGEYASVTPKVAPVILGNIGAPGAREFHVRADVDEQSAARIREGRPNQGTASIKGDPQTRFALTFVRVEPYVIPKVSLTGASTERVDTRVLQVIFHLKHDAAAHPPLYVGQQVDVFIDAAPPVRVP